MIKEKYFKNYLLNKMKIRKKYIELQNTCHKEITDTYYYIINKNTEYNPIITEDELIN